MEENMKSESNCISVEQKNISKSKDAVNDEDRLCRIYWQV